MAYNYRSMELRERLLNIVAALILTALDGGGSAVHGVICHEVLIAAFPTLAIGQLTDAVPDGVPAGGVEAAGVVAHDARIGRTPDAGPVGEAAFVAADVLACVALVGDELRPFHLGRV